MAIVCTLSSMRLLALVCVLLPTIAVADDLPDAGTDAPAPDANPASPPEVAPADVVTPTETTAPPEETGKKKKKKHKHDADAPDDVGGDLVHADDVGGVGTSQVNFRFLLQTRYTQTFVKTPLDQATVLDPRIGDGYAINRAFMRVTATPLEWLESKLLVDFAELQHKNPKHALKLAYAEMKASEHVSVTVGLFKRSFSLLELLPIADYELANPGPTDDLIKNAEFGGRDTGAMVRWSPLHKKKRLSMYLGMFSSDLHDLDARPYGLITARVVSETKHWRLGADVAVRPHGESTVPANPSSGQAVSADATYHHKSYEVRAEWLWGTRSDKPNAALALNWMAAWAIATMRFPVSDCVVLMPAARFEWLDADLGGIFTDAAGQQHGVGRRFYITGALNAMNVTDNLRVLLDVTRSQVQPHTYPINFPPLLLDRSSTIITLQAQIKI